MKINDKAADFTLLNQNGEEVTLSNYLGTEVVLFFYPKNFSPGCTAQVCSYRDNSKEFDKLNVKVIGISKDKVESHKKFESKYNLSYDTLADTTGEVIEKYGVNGFILSNRTTFILDKDHIITEIFEKTDPKTDSDRVLEVLRKKRI